MLIGENHNVYMVGIKGTGMTAMAEILHSKKALVTGSDVEEEFYTDSILRSIGIPFFSGFSKDNINGLIDGGGIDLVIYSSAYDPENHPELTAARKAGIRMMEYTEALGELSRGVTAGAVSGVHGKTTTTALAGSLVKALGLSGTVLAGSGVAGFGNRSTLIQGSDFFIAETCEYRRHFLRFHPDHIIITSIEPDHLDYYRDYDDIFSAFMELIEKLPSGGSLIYCADDKGAFDAGAAAAEKRPDLNLVSYGFNAEGTYRISGQRHLPGENRFSLAGWDGEFALRVPGEHTILDAVAALALVSGIAGFKDSPTDAEIGAMKKGLEEFSGSRRRSEILGEAGGILFMDDYAHHPSAVKTTLKGLREFHPDRRLIVDFMSHTYSRTAGLFDGFCKAFGDADILVLHKIYGSAREEESEKSEISGELLYRGIKNERDGKTVYYNEIDDARDYLKNILKPGDLFLTMGAGNNWTLGRDLYDEFRTNMKS